MNYNKSIIAGAIASALIFPQSQAIAAPVKADTDADMESIEVISGFREQNLQKIPSSVSIATSEDIERRNAQNLEEIIQASANVNFSSGSSRARYYQIRGIGERSQFQSPINPSVAVIIDGVDFTGIGSAASMYDVKQVEVLRGPQGTNFGANAMAGAVNITTNAPSEEFEGSVRVMAGNYDSASMGVSLSGPASDDLSYRIAMEKFFSDGFIENDFLNTDDTNDKDELTLRTKFHYQASADLTLDLAVFYLDFDNGYDAFSLDNDRHTLSDEPGFDKQRTLATSLTSTYTGFENVDFVNIVSFAHSNLDYGYDEDWTHTNFHDWEYSSTDYYYRDQETLTADFRLLSKESNRIFNNSTNWVVGVYVKDESQDLLREYTYSESDFNSTFDTETVAGYLQFDSQLSTKLVLSTGIRVENREADYDNSDGASFDPSDTMVGGKAVLSYQLEADVLVYGSVNRGYKAGGVNTNGSLSEKNREFDPEYVWNYELGLKQSHFDGGAYSRITFFYMDRKDMQVSTYAANKRPDGSEEFITYLDNAAEGSNQGVEVETGWQLTPEFDVYASFGYLDSEYKEFINGNDEDLSGREQAHAPSYQYNIGANYLLADHWLFNVNLDSKDSFYFSDSHEEQSDELNLVNASIVYQQETWQVKLWGRNIFDEDYETRGFYFGNDPRDGYTSKGYYQLGAPAEYGVTVDYQF